MELKFKAKIMDEAAIDRTLVRIAHECAVDRGRIHDLRLAFELHRDASVHRQTPCPSPDKAAVRREST